MNADREATKKKTIPLWVWLVAFVFAVAQPLILAWIAYFPPQGLQPTGLHIPDSALFLYSMRMFERGFESLYATCQSPYGPHGLVYYAVPHLWLYGALGYIADLLRANHLLAYGIANGVGAFLYLIAAYLFLREAAPKVSSLAFALFALSGGLGGILYAAAGLLGLHTAAGFEPVFRRYAVYELFEGPHLLPVLLMPRFYYTCSLALCFGGLAALMNGYRTGSRPRLLLYAALVAPATFIDLRYGVFALGIAVLFLLAQTDRSWWMRIVSCVLLAGPVAAGAAPALELMRMNPAVIENHFRVTNMAMWFSPFVSVALFHLFVIPGEVLRRVQTLPVWMRAAAMAALGYLGAFTALFCAYQYYFGNLLVVRDAAVATAISDWALAGAVIGGFYGLIRRSAVPAERPSDWVVLWFLLYLSLAISAFGAGWFLRYGPQRIEVFLWLPLCILSASALQRFRAIEPRATTALTAIMIGCGLCSIAIALLCFQGPLAYRPRVSPYAATHAELMTLADAHTMGRMGAGIVLAPIPASDVIVLNRGNRTVFGTGSFNLSDQPYVDLDTQVRTFFSPKATDEFRKDFIDAWCVEYIYCPDTWPVDAEVVEQLRQLPWLEELSAEGRAVLFRVAGEPWVVASASSG